MPAVKPQLTRMSGTVLALWGLMVVAGFVLTSRSSDWTPWWLVVMLGGLGFVAEVAGGRAHTASRMLEPSGSTIAVVCAIALLGVAPAMFIAVMVVGIESILRRKPWPVVIANSAGFGSFALIGGLLGGLWLSGHGSLGTAVAVVAITLVCEVVSWGIAVAVVHLIRIGPRSARFYSQQLVAILPSALAGGVLAALTVLVYDAGGELALVLLGMALLLVQFLYSRLTAVEFELRAERDKAQSYLDSAGSPFVILDEDHRVETVNRRAAELAGSSAETLLGLDFCELFAAHDVARFRDALLSARGPAVHVEGRLWDRDMLWSVAELCSPIGARQLLLSGEDITERREAERMLERLAFEDPLTRAPNRRAFAAALEDRCSESSPMAVLYIDLDGFKSINDRYGHGAGDELLCHTARRLLSTVREGDIVARQAGDEFLVLLEHLPADPDEVEQIVEEVLVRIDGALRAPYGLQTGSVSVGASIGVALFPRDGTDTEALLSAADKRMYARKRPTSV